MCAAIWDYRRQVGGCWRVGFGLKADCICIGLEADLEADLEAMRLLNFLRFWPGVSSIASANRHRIICYGGSGVRVRWFPKRGLVIVMGGDLLGDMLLSRSMLE